MNSTYSGRQGIVQLSSLILLAIALPAFGNVHFVDVTDAAGFEYNGPTWGASWRDANSDGLQDITVSLHARISGKKGKRFPPYAPIAFYINEGDGSFSNHTHEAFGAVPAGDWHGSAWADYDNDGDPDLLFLRGGGSGMARRLGNANSWAARSSNLLFEQDEQGQFIERAEAAGLSYPRMRGRRASWFDVDLDGRLDAILAQSMPDGPDSVVFLNRGSKFLPCADALPNLTPRHEFAAGLIFPGFADDGRHLLLGGASSLLYRIDESPADCQFIPVAMTEKEVTSVAYSDFVLADLDGDLALDLYGATSCKSSSFVYSSTRAKLKLIERDVAVLKFRATGGKILVRPVVGNDKWYGGPGESLVFLGATRHQAQPGGASFSTDDQQFHVPPPEELHDRGVFFHYEKDAGLWTLLVKKDRPQVLGIELHQLKGFELVQAPVLNDRCYGNADNVLYVQGKESWRYSSSIKGLSDSPINTGSITAGDFDNDADVDLVIATWDKQDAAEAVLLENVRGTFVPTPPFLSLGAGKDAVDSISSGDFDNDGFLDLFATLGAEAISMSSPTLKLYKNMGNSNSWLRVRLVGTTSSKDAFGARVFLTAEGLTQMRYASGGIRPRAQDEPILHFGLGASARVERVLVQWPNGNLEIFVPDALNQTVDLVEGAGEAVDQPMLLLAKAEQAANDETRLLLLHPGSKRDAAVEWLVNGEVVSKDHWTLVRKFGQGRNEVYARVKTGGNWRETPPVVISATE